MSIAEDALGEIVWHEECNCVSTEETEAAGDSGPTADGVHNHLMHGVAELDEDVGLGGFLLLSDLRLNLLLVETIALRLKDEEEAKHTETDANVAGDLVRYTPSQCLQHIS